MAIKKEKEQQQKEQQQKEPAESKVLEGFTYEEIGEEKIEIPDKIVENTIVVDSKKESQPIESVVESKPKENRRNKSRKIQLNSYVIDLDQMELPEIITLNFKSYAEIIKDYMFKAFILQLMGILRDKANLTNEELFKFIPEEFLSRMKLITGKILIEHKTIEDIIVTTQTVFDQQKKDDEKIVIDIEYIIKFPDHVKTYEAKDVVIIPV